MNFPPPGTAGFQPFDVVDDGIEDTRPGFFGVFHQYVLDPLDYHLATAYYWLTDSIYNLTWHLSDLPGATRNMADDVSLWAENALWHARMAIITTINWFQNVAKIGWAGLVSLHNRCKNGLTSLWLMIRRSRLIAVGLLVLFIGGGIAAVIYALHHQHV